MTKKRIVKCEYETEDCKKCGHEVPHEYLTKKNSPKEPAIGWCTTRLCRKKGIVVRCSEEEL